MTTSLHQIYTPSDQIVAREIEGELIIVPLTAGFGDMEDELYTFNPTGRALWRRRCAIPPCGRSLGGESASQWSDSWSGWW